MPSLSEIKAKIDAAKYAEAIGYLKEYVRNEAGSADAYNYLGYAYRKSGNLPDAFRAYRRALALDPRHLGAHEYLGEAYLQNHEPDKALGELETLKGICGNCEEFRDLEKAIKSGHSH